MAHPTWCKGVLMARRELWQVSRNISDSDNRIFVAMRPEKQAFGLRFWVLFVPRVQLIAKSFFWLSSLSNSEFVNANLLNGAFLGFWMTWWRFQHIRSRNCCQGVLGQTRILKGKSLLRCWSCRRIQDTQLGGPSSTGFKGDTGRNDAQLFVGIWRRMIFQCCVTFP